ncbi:MAG TPA: TolC family protein, partial [Chryseolinea sp.]|nr:TolC family protein [Chryseolinea sp.]
MRSLVLFLTFAVILVTGRAQAAPADTLRITLTRADSLFVVNNYYLLASAMNIEAQRAQILQAKLFPNPVFTADFNAYDPQNNEAFHVGQTGQKSFQVDQLITLGGKRRSQVDMAKTNTAIAELEFQNLTRQLKFKLHTKLVEIGTQQALLQKYNAQLTLVDTIMSAYEVQVTKGNIPLKDLVRLKGVYLNLNNDRAALLKEYYVDQADVQILLQTQSPIEFQFSDDDINDYIKVESLEDLELEALANHPELLLMEQNQILAQQYLTYQRRLAVPDVNFFSSY